MDVSRFGRYQSLVGRYRYVSVGMLDPRTEYLESRSEKLTFSFESEYKLFTPLYCTAHNRQFVERPNKTDKTRRGIYQHKKAETLTHSPLQLLCELFRDSTCRKARKNIHFPSMYRSYIPITLLSLVV